MESLSKSIKDKAFYTRMVIPKSEFQKMAIEQMIKYEGPNDLLKHTNAILFANNVYYTFLEKIHSLEDIVEKYEELDAKTIYDAYVVLMREVPKGINASR